MQSTSHLLELVGELYDTATDIDGWPRFLERLTRFFAADGAQFRHTDVAEDCYTVTFTHGFDSSRGLSLEEANARYEPLTLEDPRTLAGMRYPGKPISCRLHVGEAALHATEVYRRVLKPIGAEYSMAVWLPDEEARTFTAVGLWRGPESSLFTQEEADLFGQIVPHMNKALKIYKRLTESDLTARVSESLLDDIGLGILLVDASLRVRLANRSARELAARQEGFALLSDRLVPSTVEDSRVLRSAVQRLLDDASSEHASPGEALSLRRPSGAAPLYVTVSRLDNGPAKESVPSRQESLAVLFVADPERSLECPAEVLQRLFGLTPREAELLGLLVGGEPLRQVSGQLGIGLETARSHLKSVFMKTGTQRQGDLIRLVMSTPAWLRAREEAREV
ncbi:MAG: helix-turn-helix transcriptional regulator [Gammaproteobacteria bacterium]|nr:helix-turn-helix transcriptional regulator [Gammaproteobacteria bacterium]